MKYAKNQKPLEDGGFRIAWFIPVEMAITGTMLFAAPFIGLPMAILLVSLLASPLIIKIDQYIPVQQYVYVQMPREEDYPTLTAHRKAVDAWIESDLGYYHTVPGRPLPKLPFSFRTSSSRQNQTRNLIGTPAGHKYSRA